MARPDWLMMRNWARAGGFAGFCAAILICAFIFAISKPQFPRNEQEAQQFECQSDVQQSDRCRAEQESRDHAANERGLTVATWLLAFGTLFVFGAIAIQAGLFVWQLRLIREESGHTKTAAEAARRSADIAERALTENERPWVFRDIVTVTWPPYVPRTAVNAWFVSLKWKNVGRSPALLKAGIFKIANVKDLPPTPDYSGGSPLSLVAALAQGADYDTQPVGTGAPQPTDGTVIQYVFYGRIEYTEMNGKDHASGFAIMLGTHFPAAQDYNNDAYNYYT